MCTTAMWVGKAVMQTMIAAAVVGSLADIMHIA